jgi:hypothetical protein
VVVDGPVKRMKNPINHYTYKNVREHLATMNRFTSITAQEKFREGTRFRMSDWLFRPVWRFFKAFFFRGGFLDGRRGFMIAMVSSFAVAMKYAKLWELELEEKGLLGSSPDGD